MALASSERTRTSWTPGMRASLPMIEVLLRNGADPTQATKEGDTPVELALRFGHAEVADSLKQARRAVTTSAEGVPAAATA